MDEETKALIEWLRDEADTWDEPNDEWEADTRGKLHRAADALQAQAAEIERLKAIVRGWHYLAVGPDEMGDYYTQKVLIKASEPYASPALAGKAGQ